MASLTATVTRRAAIRRPVWILLLAWVLWCPALGRVSAAGRSATADLEDALQPLWTRLPGRTVWRMLVSPAFPRAWPPPPAGRGAVVRYAFAMRLPPGVADGAEMAAPWARATLGADGGLLIEPLSPRLKPLGIQGVRPLKPGETALAGREQEAADRLLAGGDGTTDPLVRDVTCNWISRQGVVAATITPHHPAFTRWLDCGR